MEATILNLDFGHCGTIADFYIDILNMKLYEIIVVYWSVVK